MVLDLKIFPVNPKLLVYGLDLEAPEALWVIVLVDLSALNPWPAKLEMLAVVGKRIGYAVRKGR